METTDRSNGVKSLQDAEKLFQKRFGVSPEQSSKIGRHQKQKMFIKRRLELEQERDEVEKSLMEDRERIDLIERCEAASEAGDLIVSGSGPTTFGESNELSGKIPGFSVDMVQLIKTLDQDNVLIKNHLMPLYKDNFTPGSIPFIRAQTLVAGLPGVDPETFAPYVYGAKPIFMSAELCKTLSQTEPPGHISDFKLPFDLQSVFFATPLEIPFPRRAFNTGESEEINDTFIDNNAHVFYALANPQAKIVGINFVTDPDTLELWDVTSWIVQIKPGSFRLFVGSISNSTLKNLIHNVIALVSIKMPTAVVPPQEHLPEGQKELKHLKKTNTFRKKLSQGVYSNISIIDLSREEQAGSSHHIDGQGRKIRCHWRRGYWRRQRCGPRNSFHYEQRFIHPQWIEGKADGAITQIWKAS